MNGTAFAPGTELSGVRVAQIRRPVVISRVAWWLAAATILAASLIFHSRLDPSDRLLEREMGTLGEVPWFQQQAIAGFAPADLAVICFAFAAILSRLARHQGEVSRRATYVTLAIASVIAVGVTVGELSVVGARSVVVKDLPARMICAGSPCRPLRERPEPKPDK